MRNYVILKRPVLYFFFLFAINYGGTLVVCQQPFCFLECSQDFQFLFLASLPPKGWLNATSHEFQFPRKEFIDPRTDYGLYVA